MVFNATFNNISVISWRYYNIGTKSPCLTSSCVSSRVLSRKITVVRTSSRIRYDLWNVNSVRWWCWNISTDERVVDYWKSEVITFVIEFKVKIRSRLLSVNSIFYFKPIWIDEMQITESRIVQWQYITYIA